MGWGGAKNGVLLVLAATAFDAFITVDKNLPYQQNLTTLPVAVVALRAAAQAWRWLQKRMVATFPI